MGHLGYFIAIILFLVFIILKRAAAITLIIIFLIKILEESMFFLEAIRSRYYLGTTDSKCIYILQSKLLISHKIPNSRALSFCHATFFYIEHR